MVVKPSNSLLDKFNKILYFVANIGLDSEDNEHERNVKMNNLNWLFYSTIILFNTIYFFIFFFKSPLLIILNIIIFSLYSLVIVFSYYKFYLLSRCYNLIFLIACIFFFSVIFGKESNLMLMYIPILIQVFLVFNYKEKLFLFIFVSIIYFLFFFYNFRADLIGQFTMFHQYGMVIHDSIIYYLLFFMTLIMLFNYYENILIDKQVEYQEKYFSRILNSLPVEIIVMDEKFKYRFINKEAIKDDHMREWLIGKDDYDYVKYRAKNKSIADERFEFYRSVSSNQEYGHLEEVIYTAQGQKKYTDKTLMYIDDEDLGSAMRYIGYSIDSTSKKEAEIMLKQYMLKLEKSNEELKQFAYITSHDLKSPLRNINSLLQLTKKRNENILDQDSKDLIETCIKSANYLYTVVGDVLLYTTSEADKSVYVKIDLNDIISEIIKNNTVFFKEKKAEIILKKEFPQIFSHRTMMFNLFSNLIQNGIKYNKSEVPKVTIDYTESEDYYYFSVSDNGIGIDEKYKDQIFIVFKRLHNQSEYEGTGIGLSICKQIVENLGGSISFISKLGEGSTFYFNLPKSKQLDSH